MTRAQKTSDEVIKNLLETLRDVPSRLEDEAQERRVAFLDSLEKLPEPVSPHRFWRLNLRSAFLSLRLRTLTIAVILVSLFGGGTYTANAAQTALPGEGLYPVKIWVEQLRTALTFSDQDKLRLHLEFASERLDEIAELESRGIFEIPQEVVDDFNHHIQEANSLLPSNAEYGTEIKGLITKFDELEGDEEEPEELEEPGDAADQPEIDQDDIDEEDDEDGSFQEAGEDKDDAPGESSTQETNDPDEQDDEHRDQNPSPGSDDDDGGSGGSSREPDETDEPDNEEDQANDD